MLVFRWWRRWDSNPQHPPCKGGALPIGATSPVVLVGARGFEPRKDEPADLQSAPVDRFGTLPVHLPSLSCMIFGVK